MPRPDLSAGPRLWLVHLDEAPDGYELLDANEQERLGSFRRVVDARRYYARRSALRLLLGAAVDQPPGRVALEVGPHGKPRLAGEASISFNLSHCGETAVIALAEEGSIGVDLERMRPHTSPERLAARFFEPGEAATIAALPAALVESAFMRCWTAKEAVLKAIGVGLAEPLSEVVVTADPRLPLSLRAAPGPLSPAGWTLHELGVRRGRLTLALAVRAPEARIAGVHSFAWPEPGATV